MLEMQFETQTKVALEVIGGNWVLEEVDPLDPHSEEPLRIVAAGSGKKRVRLDVLGFMAVRVSGDGPCSVRLCKNDPVVRVRRKPSWAKPRMPEDYEAASLRHQRALQQQERAKLAAQMHQFAVLKAQTESAIADLEKARNVAAASDQQAKEVSE